MNSFCSIFLVTKILQTEPLSSCRKHSLYETLVKLTPIINIANIFGKNLQTQIQTVSRGKLQVTLQYKKGA